MVLLETEVLEIIEYLCILNFSKNFLECLL